MYSSWNMCIKVIILEANFVTNHHKNIIIRLTANNQGRIYTETKNLTTHKFIYRITFNFIYATLLKYDTFKNVLKQDTPTLFHINRSYFNSLNNIIMNVFTLRYFISRHSVGVKRQHADSHNMCLAYVVKY